MHWEDVPKGQDPPDFYLTINPSVFAVEVTSTEVMRDVAIGGGRLRQETYYRNHTELVKRINRAAQERGILSGAYSIRFCRPLAARYSKHLEQSVIKASLEYIQRTQHMSVSEPEDVSYEYKQVCWISKSDNRFNKISRGFLDAAWGESPEVTEKVCGMLQKAIGDKKAKFERKGESAPKLLLLLNTYDFATSGMYEECARRAEDLSFFHSVFVVWPDGNWFLLHSIDERWTSATNPLTQTTQAERQG